MKTESNLLRLPSNLGNCEQGSAPKDRSRPPSLRYLNLDFTDFNDLNGWLPVLTSAPNVSDFTDLIELTRSHES
jgi:hypothetical protein